MGIAINLDPHHKMPAKATTSQPTRLVNFRICQLNKQAIESKTCQRTGSDNTIGKKIMRCHARVKRYKHEKTEAKLTKQSKTNQKWTIKIPSTNPCIRNSWVFVAIKSRMEVRKALNSWFLRFAPSSELTIWKRYYCSSLNAREF